MFEIEWSDDAWFSYQETVKFWVAHNHSTSYSEKIIEEVEYIEMQLISDISIGQKTEYPGIFRMRFLKNFSLFYKVKNKKIEILAFWDARRNPENLDF